MENYKNDIELTRKGCVGSSDAAMLMRIAQYGGVPKSAMRRLAVVKGLAENENIPVTAAVAFGDKTELDIYNMLADDNPKYESNPRWESEKYSRKNVKAITHPDIVFEDNVKKVIYVYEVKASVYNTNIVRNKYAAQLYYHKLLADERAAQYGKEWKARVFLAHYLTDGLDLAANPEFDASRLTLREIRPAAVSLEFDLSRAMDIVDAFLEDFNEYYDGEEIDGDLLPASVKDEFTVVTNILAEIKEREAKVDEFKKKLHAFMLEKGIKSIKNDQWSITRVEASEVKTFDYKRYLDDIAKEHPRRARKLMRDYSKTTNRKGTVMIKLKNNV